MNDDRYSPCPFDEGEDISELVRASCTPNSCPCVARASARADEKTPACNDDGGALPYSRLNGFPIAMVYAPNAPFEDLYETPREALAAGTLFRALDLPLEAVMKGGRR